MTRAVISMVFGMNSLAADITICSEAEGDIVGVLVMT